MVRSFVPFAADGGDEILRNAAEAEAAHEDGGAVGEVSDSGVGGGDTFVHSVLWGARGEFTSSGREAGRRHYSAAR